MTTVVFDFAGVLFCWHPPTMLMRVLPQRAPDLAAGAHLAQAIFQGYGGDWADFDRGTIEVEPLVARIVARTGLAPTEVRAVVDEVPHELQPMPDTVALLRRLHALGQRLYFLSNMPAPYADHLQRSHRFLELFADGLYSARERLIKPESAIFDLAAYRFGRPAGELLFFDDVPANVAAARAAGWQARLFIDAEGCASDLRAAGLYA